jgi:kynurenine formamidase
MRQRSVRAVAEVVAASAVLTIAYVSVTVRLKADTTYAETTYVVSGFSQTSRVRFSQTQQPATQSSVTKQQFDEWMTKLSNWGRWGKDDERGALNLITAEKRRQAAALAKSGTIVSLSLPVIKERPAAGAGPRPVNRIGAGNSVFLIDGDYLFERQEIEYHGARVSHFDALCHVSYNGKLYNGLDFKSVVTEDGGCSKLAVTTAQDGIVTRGILLDIPGTRVRRADVEAWEKKTGLRISPGDALLLRTQATGSKPGAFGAAGYEPSLIPFLKERDIALLGSDVAQEGGTIPGVAIPIHVFTIVALGVNLLDNLALQELAATAAKLNRWEFMLVVEPLRVPNGAGSPVNPVAVF